MTLRADIQVVREVVRRGQWEGIFRRDVSDGVVAHCMFGAIDELLSSAVFTGRVSEICAVVMARLQLDAANAEKRLDDAEGFLARALGEKR